MHIWTMNKWKKILVNTPNCRTGIRIRIESSVDKEVNLACKNFVCWLRTEYTFPLRVPIYVKASKYLTSLDGDKVVGTFFEPLDYSVEPYIRIATGDYESLKQSIGKDNALASILLSIAHELTHYYQWINNIELTPIGIERQATRYAHLIVDEYALTREHP